MKSGKRLALLWNLRNRLQLTWALVQDPRVPTWQKAIPFLPFLYIFSPMNLWSFAIPVLGQIDDATLIYLAIELLERVVDKDILEEHRQRLEAEV